MKRILLVVIMLQSLFGMESKVVELKYISPSDLESGLNSSGFTDNIQQKYVLNESNNTILLKGTQLELDEMEGLINFLDVPPRQIIISVKIIETTRQDIIDSGIDWSIFINSLRLDFSSALHFSTQFRTDQPDYNTGGSQLQVSARNNYVEPGFLNVLLETGIAKIVSSPQIVTTNNQKGSIFDGEHVTYISRYSSFTNLYETQELNSGLSLEVTPSIGQDDMMTLEIEAKYTFISGYLEGSPIESGQILNNRVIVKDAEPFLLGAFNTTTEQSKKRKFPLLGSILPFLFSAKDNASMERVSLIVLEPTIIDLKGSAPPKGK
ncbi:MAG: hypothetical protein HQ556_05170 [Candidatus Marinimicrobia bacterium]|nr:hypothetical protein [Candidatus Neomarinimicrobiota bacterium]